MGLLWGHMLCPPPLVAWGMPCPVLPAGVSGEPFATLVFVMFGARVSGHAGEGCAGGGLWALTAARVHAQALVRVQCVYARGVLYAVRHFNRTGTAMGGAGLWEVVLCLCVPNRPLTGA